MPNEGFLQRWSRLKAEPAPAATVPATAPATAAPAFPAGGAAAAPAPARDARSIPAVGAPQADAPLPTLADAALLDAGSDYSAFVARGVDADVRRLAMKKLFADPHFNVIDGLDIYMADYNVPSPVSAAMLASLSHAKSVFACIDELLEPAPDEATPATAAPATEAPAPPPPPPPPDQEAA